MQGFLTGLRRLLPQLQALADILPAPTLDWKLDLLLEGCKYGPMQCLEFMASGGFHSSHLEAPWSVLAGLQREWQTCGLMA